MNVENILRVADAIEQHSIPDLGFNMARWYGDGEFDRSGHECETVACIGGWAMHLLSDRNVGAHDFDDVDHAARLLGINRATSTDLFYALGCLTSFDEITPSHAVAVLRHLAKTGEVDWSISPEQGGTK